MIRTDIISTIGRKYLSSNIENGEFSYVKALKNVGKILEIFNIILKEHIIKILILDLKMID